MRVRQDFTIDLEVVQQFNEKIPKGERSRAVEKALVNEYDLEKDD